MMGASSYCVAVFLFTLFDVYGYGKLVQPNKLDPAPYRVMQLMFQGTLYALLLALHEYGALAGFMFAHFSFACDYFYYILRGEDYSGYTITWFSTSLPSLICKLFGVPFTGKMLQWIGPTACALGLFISIFFA